MHWLSAAAAEQHFQQLQQPCSKSFLLLLTVQVHIVSWGGKRIPAAIANGPWCRPVMSSSGCIAMLLHLVTYCNSALRLLVAAVVYSCSACSCCILRQAVLISAGVIGDILLAGQRLSGCQ